MSEDGDERGGSKERVYVRRVREHTGSGDPGGNGNGPEDREQPGVQQRRELRNGEHRGYAEDDGEPVGHGAGGTAGRNEPAGKRTGKRVRHNGSADADGAGLYVYVRRARKHAGSEEPEGGDRVYENRD